MTWTLLPDAKDGWLPYLLLLASLLCVNPVGVALLKVVKGSSLAAFNTFGTYYASRRPWTATQALYPNVNVTAMQCRTFGTWTSISAAVRLLAAYNIDVQPVYQLALVTYAAAAVHWNLECFYYHSMTIKSYIQAGAPLDMLATVVMVYGLVAG